MNKIEKEILRLKEKGLNKFYNDNILFEMAELTLKINELKKEKNAIILAHVYQNPEIALGVGDFLGDSYKLSKDSQNTNAEKIIFCGVKFMAETAKILNPQKKVYLPDNKALCTLSDSIKAKDVKKLKKLYPNSPVVTYINTSAEVKAESDVIVTSANAEKILTKLFKDHERIIFLPDKYMGGNLARKLNKKIGKKIILWNGSCSVHEKFNSKSILELRKRYKGIFVLAHSECPKEIIDSVDFMGGTGDMFKKIEGTNAPYYMIISECGMDEIAQIKFKNKKFLTMCRLCPYMKLINLKNILQTLENPKPEQEIFVPERIALKAKKAIDEMFKLSQ